MKTQNKNTNKDSTKLIIHPDNLYKLSFDIIGFLLIVYQTVMVPYSISFEVKNTAIDGFNYFSDVFFIIDILINFNTGIYHDGVLILERKDICLSYLKGWFCFDFISSFPYSFIFDNLEVNISV